MMNRLIAWALHNQVLTLVAAVILLAIGFWNLPKMQVDVLPDLAAPSVTIMTEAPGMAPTEVESLVTLPIESALNGAAGVRRIRSASSIGLSEVWVDFNWDADVMKSRQTVAERLASIGETLPAEAQRPFMAPDSSIMGEVMFVGLTSKVHTQMEMNTYARGEFSRRLLSIPGVATVIPSGGEVRQFQITISPEKLALYGLTLDEVISALEQSNQNAASGVMNDRGNQWLVVGMGRIKTIEDIKNTLLAYKDSSPITVGDVGMAQIAPPLARGSASVNGEPGVLLGILKQTGQNTLELTQQLDHVLNELEAQLPTGMNLHRNLFRQADFIETSIANVERALLEGIILVILVVFLFLGNIRATLITITAIPLSLVSAILILKAFGITINTMTLGGMVIAIGALVDDAVIDVENVFRRLRESYHLPPGTRPPFFKTVLEASVEIRSSIVFATAIIALVFTPLFFLSGVEGRLMAPLGVAYLAALLASLMVAMTVTPVLCFLLLPHSKAVRAGKEMRWVSQLKGLYSNLLSYCMKHPWQLTLPTLSLLLIALGSMFFLGRAFLPDFNEGSLTINAITLPGTSLPESKRLAEAVESTLLAFPEVTSVGCRTGRGDNDTHGSDVEGSEFDVNIKLQSRSRKDFLQELREELAEIPGISITIGQPISHRLEFMLSGSKSGVAIKIFGPNLYKLRSLAHEVSEQVENVPGVADLSVEMLTDVPLYQTRFDREALARYGLTIQQVSRYLEAAVRGVSVTHILEDRMSFDVVLKLAGEEPWRLETLADVLINTPSGAQVPLSAVAQMERTSGPNRVNHEAIERKIIVSCNVVGRDAVSFVNECRKKIEPLFTEEPGYHVEYGGQFESASRASHTLLLLSFAVAIGIVLLLQAAFKSTRDALLVMVNLPFALIGGALGVWVSGGILSVASLIGFITVFGIAARNGIMLVSHIHHLQLNEGITDFHTAILRGAKERLLPILMTALAAGLALIPLALTGDKPGNEIQSPMAIVILFGLMSSMVLNMFIVPALYLKLARPLTVPSDNLQPSHSPSIEK